MNTTVLDKINNKKFKSGIEFQKQLLQLARTIQDSLLANLSSNYSKDRNTNLSEFFRAVSLEFARLQVSSSDVNEDKYNTETRAEYLYQILGDSLFLGEKAINENLSDTAYRAFLLKVRNAYYEGSRKQNIEDAVSDIIGLPVTIKELYLDLRKQSSFYSLKDTHKMFFDILMDDATATSSIGIILEDIRFFIDLIKPAHVIYDTRLIWTDRLTNRDASCKPSYIKENMDQVIYGTSRIYLVTYLASSIYKFAGVDSEETWVEGTIQSINLSRGIFNLTDNKILVYNESTKLYVRDGAVDTEILPDAFSIGDVIKYYATKDSADSTSVIDTDWSYTGTIDEIFLTEELITLLDGSGIVYNDNTLVYTRDYSGEYRIEIDDLSSNREIVFKAERNTQSYQFYRTPPVVQNNDLKQFDNDVIARPIFQEYVLKNKEIPPGTHEGYDVYVVDGVAVVKNISSKFYARENAKSNREVTIDKYTLSIDGVVQKQFQIDDPSRQLTESEAKSVFITSYGYTGLQDSSTSYTIGIARTGELVEDGPDSFVQTIEGHTEACDRKAACQLVPMYEDVRKYFTWPDLQLTSGFFDVYRDFHVSTGSGFLDVPAWYYLSADPNVYVMPYLPMLGPDGQPAETSDVVVYLNGKKIEDAIDTIDAWSGVVSLNFIPPFDTKLRIDYYYSKRYPDPVYYLRQVTSQTIQSPANNLVGTFNIINPDGLTSHLTWPFEVTDPALYGDDQDYQMNKFPMLNNKGELVTKEEISVSVGSTVSSGTVRVTETDDTGSTLFNQSGADWTGVSDGDIIVIQYNNYLDNTLIYVIESVDLMSNTLRLPSTMPVLGAEYLYTIVHFIDVADAVDAVRPLLGHVRLNFLPPVNSFIRVNYYYTPYERNYLMLPDAVPEDVYGSSSYTADTFYGSKNNYTLAVDANPDIADVPYWPFDDLLKIGHRYRAFSLPHSAVLNSEQMVLNDYDVYKDKASFANHAGLLNKFDLMFSAEFLTDTDKNVVLNDKYLQKDLPPVTVLNPGVPVFAESFSDDAHHTNAIYADEHDTYDSDFVGGMDFRAGFTIIDPDNSGIIDYNPVCGIESNRQINLYSDFKEVEFPNGGYDANLTTIDEGGTSLPFKFAFIEQYYPNRELRLVDYLDYINQVPTEYRSGSIRVLNNSSVIKSIDKNFKALNVGDVFTVKNVPVVVQILGVNTTVFKDLDYTLIQIIDFETARIHQNFKGTSGTYQYALTRSKVYASDVSLFGGSGETAPSFLVGNLNRAIVLNGILGHSYSLPDAVLKHLPGYGDTGANFMLSFPDPDPDPYPRNPDNPWIPNPTGISYLTLSEYVIDGKTYRNNRINATTGLVKTSQIIDAQGNSFGYTGYATGVTGPSGALDLGITGPVGDVNPRVFKPSDSYIIPSGATGIFLSKSEAEYRVQWRNWDQDMIILALGVTGSVMVEDPVNLMDDLGEGIKRSYWSVATASLREMRLQGTVIESFEQVSSSVPAVVYPNGLILLTQDEVDQINASLNPVVDLPGLHLADANYRLNRRIVRELLHDDSIKITEIQEFVRL
jgi:hypothetical protein